MTMRKSSTTSSVPKLVSTMQKISLTHGPIAGKGRISKYIQYVMVRLYLCGMFEGKDACQTAAWV